MIENALQREVTQRAADQFTAAIAQLELEIAELRPENPDCQIGRFEIAQLQLDAMRSVRDELLDELAEYDRKQAP